MKQLCDLNNATEKQNKNDKPKQKKKNKPKKTPSSSSDDSKSGKQTINPSKRHRDRLNGELDNLARLLPFPEDVIARLDKLSILRLSVSYLRNRNFFHSNLNNNNEDTKSETRPKDSKFPQLIHEALEGFILVLTFAGEVFYVSDGIKEYLGYSQSQMLHQPMETFVHDDDRNELKKHLRENKIQMLEDNGEIEDIVTGEMEFVLRLKSILNTTSNDVYKPFTLTGTIRRLNIKPEVESLKHALFCLCSPTQSLMSIIEVRMKSMLFCTKNRIDLSFLDLDSRGKEFFGYTKKEIFGRSSYVLVHRSDLQHLRCKHTEVMTCGKTSLGTFRLMSKTGEWGWVCGYAKVVYKNGKADFVTTTNRIMSEEEGQAMLKLRDNADFKSLESIGLIEPDDPVKALEIGFPDRTKSNIQSNGNPFFDSIRLTLDTASESKTPSSDQEQHSPVEKVEPREIQMGPSYTQDPPQQPTNHLQQQQHHQTDNILQPTTQHNKFNSSMDFPMTGTTNGRQSPAHSYVSEITSSSGGHIHELQKFNALNDTASVFSRHSSQHEKSQQNTPEFEHAPNDAATLFEELTNMEFQPANTYNQNMQQHTTAAGIPLESPDFTLAGVFQMKHQTPAFTPPALRPNHHNNQYPTTPTNNSHHQYYMQQHQYSAYLQHQQMLQQRMMQHQQQHEMRPDMSSFNKYNTTPDNGPSQQQQQNYSAPQVPGQFPRASLNSPQNNNMPSKFPYL